MTALHAVENGGPSLRGPSVAVSTAPGTAATLGSSGIIVSRLAFGGWGIAATDWGGVTDIAAARRAIACALELGITFFDTAPSYGEGSSESLLGLMVGGPDGAARRDRIVLATKCGPRSDPSTSLESSLRRLRTDYVDLLQLHEPPREPDALERLLERMHALVDRGLVRALGLCNATERELTRAFGVVPLASYQGPYNLFDRDAEHDALAFTRTHACAFLAYRPLASGLLTGKYAGTPSFAAADHRARLHWFRGREFARRQTVLECLRTLARERDLSLAQLALAWLLAKPDVTAVLAGARTAAQVEENAMAARTALSSADMAAIDATVSDAYAPRALRRTVHVDEVRSADGEVSVRVRDDDTERTLTVGPREAYVMRRLDGRTPYATIAAEWTGADGQRLLAAQVILLVDQLAELGLLDDAPDA